MKTSSLLSKIITLTCFIILLSGFVAYRSGLFAVAPKHTFTIANDSTKKARRDTLGLPPGAVHMSSSKSARIFEDSSSLESISRLLKDSNKTGPTFMSSSKSIHPIIPMSTDSSK